MHGFLVPAALPSCRRPRLHRPVETQQHRGRRPTTELRRSPIVNISVRDNNVEQALRALKKKMQREGTFREMKRRKFYEKPSEKRARQKAEAVRRARKLARKKAQREGSL